MHYVKVKGILSAQNRMNLYRGCQHGCIYCDSRSACYQMNHPFADIEVKENAFERLEDALKRKRHRCMIGTGSMSDPYMPLERELCMTKGALEHIDRYGFGVSILTKSDLILRDMELYQRIHSHSKVVVQMTLTTFDEKLCRIVEPGVCTTARRVEVLKQFRDAGIPTLVWLSPILPFLNDTEENLRGILESCAEAGVKGILCFGMGMTLREGNREYYYSQLDQHFPGLKEEYFRNFGNAYEISSPNGGSLWKVFTEFCDRHGIWRGNDRLFRFLSTYEEKQEQLTLF